MLLLHWLSVKIVSHLLRTVTALGNLIELLELLTMVLGNHLLALLLLLLLLLLRLQRMCLNLRV